MLMSSVDSMHGLLNQMHAMANVSAAKPISAPIAASQTGGFAAELTKALQSVSSAQIGATQKQHHFIMGTGDVQLNDVMIDMQKASIGFQAAVQVRNKLVAAYQTIASMPL